MASSYGYTAPNYGYYRPPAQKGPTVQTRALAMAAGQKSAPTPNNPFGIATGIDSAGDGSLVTPPVAASHVLPTATPPAVAPAAAASPSAPAVSPTAQTAASNASSGFDINTDPQFAQTNSLLTSGPGSSDENLNASALKQRKDAVLAYGDPVLAQKLLGDSTLAEAAAKNPTSTLSQLSQGHDRTIHDLTEGLNHQNLLYSGYRVKQEGAAGQDYQNALAAAAQAVNGQLGGIDSQLAQALGANQATRVSALNSAYDRHKTDAGATGTTAPPVTDPLGAGDALSGLQGAPDFLKALALAARTHQNVAV